MPVTFTEKVQEAPAARVAPDRLTLFEPTTAVIVPPPHEPFRPLGDDTISPDGKVSLNASPVSVVAVFGFVSVKLRPVLPKNNSTCESAKAFVRVGGAATVSVADAAVPFPSSIELTGPVVLLPPLEDRRSRSHFHDSFTLSAGPTEVATQSD
jgi:hypothetical protein